jgi:hypothetical protein
MIRSQHQIDYATPAIKRLPRWASTLTAFAILVAFMALPWLALQFFLWLLWRGFNVGP